MPNDWGPLRSMSNAGVISNPVVYSTNAAQVASGWGNPNLMQNYLSAAYNLGFSERANNPGVQLSENAWRGIRAGRPQLSGGYISPYSPYLGTWSPYLPGSGRRDEEGDLERAIDKALAETDEGHRW